MRFSVVIPSYLGIFPRCATNRPEKFIRAVNSLLNQTFTDWEAIIIGDGCTLTGQIIDTTFRGNPKLRYIPIPKQRLWSQEVRNTGIRAALGDYITYLDTDDILGPNHLELLAEQIKTQDWVWYDDYVMAQNGKPRLNLCKLELGRCGTSNITHARRLNMLWNDSTYAHDWRFILHLQRHRNFEKIQPGEYIICHQPPSKAGPGFDY